MKLSLEKLVLIPIEIPVREMESKAGILADELSKVGYDVIYGDQKVILELAKHLAGTIILWKNLNCSKNSVIVELSKRNSIILLHEEGFISYHERTARAASRELIEVASKVFTWGPYQRNVFLALYGEISHKFVSTGHPRIDLGLEYSKKRKLSRDENKITNVLINSRFSDLFHPKGPDFYERSAALYYKDAEFASRLMDQSRKDFEFFKKVYWYFKDNKNFNVTLRPHPSESKTELAKAIGLETVDELECNTDINESIFVHDLIIASQCQTAFEAAIQGKLVFSLQAQCDDPDLILPWIDEISSIKVNSIAQLDRLINIKDSLQCGLAEDIILNKETIVDSSIVDSSHRFPCTYKIVREIQNLDHDFKLVNLPISWLLLCNLKFFLQVVRRFLGREQYKDHYLDYLGSKRSHVLTSFLTMSKTLVLGKLWLRRSN